MAASPYTLAEAKEMLKVWKDCEMALASGQAKEYQIGTRSFTSVDLPDIVARVNYFANKVDQLSGNSRTTRVTRIVPRDL